MKRIILIITIHFSLLVFNCFPQQPGWIQINSGTTEELNSVHFLNYEIGYACGNSGTITRSIDSGKTWQAVQIPISITLNDIFFFDQTNVLAVGNGGTIIRTTDGGTNWDFISSGVTDDLLSVSFVDSFGICGALSQTILYTSNSGASWHIAQSGFFGGGFWGASMLSPQIGFVAGENTIFQPLLGKTIDSGQNWNFTAFYLNNNEGKATGVDFTDELTGYVSSQVWDGRGAISKTTDGGTNWVTTFFNNPLWGIDFPISGASLIGYTVGYSGGILKTYNAGLNWQPQQSGTSLRLNKVHFIDLDYGIAVGENGIVLRTTTGGEPITQVKENIFRVNDFNLYQNFPNPFNPITTIKFTISDFPAGSGTGRFTILKVYDVLCNEVATLVNEEKLAGSYEVEFSAIGGDAYTLPSGIYFYRLQAGNFVETKKMVFLK